MTRTFFFPWSPPYPDFMKYFFSQREGTVALISGDGPTDVRTVSPPFSPCVQLSSQRSQLFFYCEEIQTPASVSGQWLKAPSQKAPLFDSFPLVAPQHRCSLGPLHPTLSRPWEDLFSIRRKNWAIFSIWTSFWCVLDSALAEDCIAPSK